MIEHKKRVIFYPMQLRDFVRDHGAELPIGIPVAYDTIKPERYCIVRPNRFRFYHELCGDKGHGAAAKHQQNVFLRQLLVPKHLKLGKYARTLLGNILKFINDNHLATR